MLFATCPDCDPNICCPNPLYCPYFAFGLTSLSKSVVSNNKFTGTANYAVYMGDSWFPDPTIQYLNTGSANTFYGNNISGLSLASWNIYDDFGNVLFTVLPNTYYFSATTSNNTVGGNSGGESYVYSGSSSNNITGPGLPRNGGIAIGQNKIPASPKHKLTPAEQAAVDKFRNAKHRL